MKRTIVCILLIFSSFSSIANNKIKQFYGAQSTCSIQETHNNIKKNPIFYKGKRFDSALGKLCVVDVPKKKFEVNFKYCFLTGFVRYGETSHIWERKKILSSQACYFTITKNGNYSFQFTRDHTVSCSFACFKK